MIRRYIIPLISLIGTVLVVIGKKIQPKMAYPKSFSLKSISQTTNEITFNLRNERGPFRIYRENKLVYEGEDDTFTDKDLIEGTTYLYTIEIGSRRGTPERMKVQTSTAVQSKEAENVLQDTVITTIISRSLVSMEWEPIEGVEEYVICRNGKRIAKVEEPFFVDRWVASREEYTYWIYAERPMTKSEKDFDEEKFLVAGVIGFFKKGADERDAVMEKFQITKVLDPLEEILHSEDAAPERKEWRFQYKTFLNRAWFKNPNPASPYRYFKGDGRGFDPAAPEYRTMAEVVVTDDESFPDVRLNKDVGETKGYGMLRNLKKEETASDEGIQLEDVEIEEKKISFVLKHSVGNPLVTSPEIDYHVWGNLYHNGFYDIVGIHDQSPHHEVYLKHGVQRTWTTLHQSESEGLEWLAEPMAGMYWRVSNFK